jgi:hypothetical protein
LVPYAIPNTKNSPWSDFSTLLNRLSFMTMFLILCYSCTAGHLPEESSQLLLGTTVALGLFLQLLAAPYD